MGNTKIFLLITTFLFLYVNNYPTCSTIIINGYIYDLFQLPQDDGISITGQSKYISFSFCQPNQKCGSNEKSFAVINDTGDCQPFTDSRDPLIQNYSLIDASSPQLGLSLKYLPYKDSAGQISRWITLNIYCTNNYFLKQSCTLTSSGSVDTMICNLPSYAGCPTLKQNYFWQFLSNNKVLFAIILWVIALFQLFFGYLAIRITIFIFGTLSGATFGIIYMAQNYQDFIYQTEGYGIAVFVICLSTLMGVLYGISLLTMPRLGYINIGFWVAIIFSLLLQNSVLYLTQSLLAFYITVGVVGLIMTAIASMAFKNYIIISTAFVSAFWLVRPLGFFLSSYPNQFRAGQSYLLNSATQWQFYLYLISIIILTVLGSVFQFCCFKKSNQGNQAYYLEEQGTFNEKLKKLLQFQQLKGMVRNGTNQLRFLKRLIIDDTTEQYQSKDDAKYQAQSNNQQSEEQQRPKGRKPTKLQKQLTDFNKKKNNKQVKNKVYYKRVQDVPRNRKKVQVQQIQITSQQEAQQIQRTKKQKQKNIKF